MVNFVLYWVNCLPVLQIPNHLHIDSFFSQGQVQGEQLFGWDTTQANSQGLASEGYRRPS